VDVRQVKGLEFDYVVLVGVSSGAYPDRPNARRLLHVAATRAIHHLWVTWIGSPSPLIGAPA
jgi:DNA helicase-2/ATP-dependent DNA helicase PcrA